MKNEKNGACLAQGLETQASDSTGFRKDSKAKLNQLLTLEKVLEQYDEMVFEKPEDVSLSGQFVMDLVDEINAKLNKHLESKIRLTNNNVLMTNFETMTNLKHWLKSRLFQDLPKQESKLLKEKIEEMVDLLKTLWVKIVKVDAEFADHFLERMKKSCRKYRATDYDMWKAKQPRLTMERLTEYQAELTADMLIGGILKYDDKPHGEEMDGVDLCKLKKKLKNRKDLPENFDEECAKLRRYSYWEGEMFMIDYQLLRNYIYRVFRLLTNDQRIDMFYYDVQMNQIHEDLRRLMAQEQRSELTSKAAMIYWKRLMELGFVDENCKLKPGTSRQQAMYIAEPFSEKLGLKSKWKDFEEFWGIKNLAQEKWSFQEKGSMPPRYQEIDRVFVD